jgi:hypothetical protein
MAQRGITLIEALIDAAKLDILLNGRNCNAAGVGSSGTNPTPPLFPMIALILNLISTCSSNPPYSRTTS